MDKTMINIKYFSILVGCMMGCSSEDIEYYYDVEHSCESLVSMSESELVAYDLTDPASDSPTNYSFSFKTENSIEIEVNELTEDITVYEYIASDSNECRSWQSTSSNNPLITAILGGTIDTYSLKTHLGIEHTTPSNSDPNVVSAGVILVDGTEFCLTTSSHWSDSISECTTTWVLDGVEYTSYTSRVNIETGTVVPLDGILSYAFYANEELVLEYNLVDWNFL